MLSWCLSPSAVLDGVMALEWRSSRSENAVRSCGSDELADCATSCDSSSAGQPCRVPPQIYEEALKSAACAAVHLTEIETEYECDTFFPPLDRSVFSLWSATAPHRTKADRCSFLCYTRAEAVADQPQLPPAVASRHEELQVVLPPRLLSSSSEHPRPGGHDTAD